MSEKGKIKPALRRNPWGAAPPLLSAEAVKMTGRKWKPNLQNIPCSPPSKATSEPSLPFVRAVIALAEVLWVNRTRGRGAAITEALAQISKQRPMEALAHSSRDLTEEIAEAMTRNQETRHARRAAWDRELSLFPMPPLLLPKKTDA